METATETVFLKYYAFNDFPENGYGPLGGSIYFSLITIYSKISNHQVQILFFL